MIILFTNAFENSPDSHKLSRDTVKFTVVSTLLKTLYITYLFFGKNIIVSNTMHREEYNMMAMISGEQLRGWAKLDELRSWSTREVAVWRHSYRVRSPRLSDISYLEVFMCGWLISSHAAVVLVISIIYRFSILLDNLILTLQNTNGKSYKEFMNNPGAGVETELWWLNLRRRADARIGIETWRCKTIKLNLKATNPFTSYPFF